MRSSILCSILMLFLLSSNFAWAVPWSEVTRFTGSGDYTTNYFICDHAEWRINWNYKPNSTIPEIAVFNIYVYSRNEASLIGVITEYGNTTTVGTTYIHNRQGEFYLKFRVANLEGYNAIIEQDMGLFRSFHQLSCCRCSRLEY